MGKYGIRNITLKKLNNYNDIWYERRRYPYSKIFEKHCMDFKTILEYAKLLANSSSRAHHYYGTYVENIATEVIEEFVHMEELLSTFYCGGYHEENMVLGM